MTKAIVVLVAMIAMYLIVLAVSLWRTRQARAHAKRVEQYFGARRPQLRRFGKKKASRAELKRLERLADELYVADISLRTEEFITIWVVLALLVPALAMFLGAPLTVTIALVLIGAAAPIAYVKVKRNKRLAAFGKQLSDALAIICNALRAGMSFQTAMKNVSEEMEDPIAHEFGRVYRETQLGMPLETSLNRLVLRTGNQDLELMCQAVIIQRQVGGNLAQILENISGTINERVKMKGEIKAMTASGTLSGYIVGGLPVFLLLMLMLLNPGYADVFFSTQTGNIMLVISVVMEAVGFLLVRKIVHIKL